MEELKSPHSLECNGTTMQMYWKKDYQERIDQMEHVVSLASDDDFEKDQFSRSWPELNIWIFFDFGKYLLPVDICHSILNEFLWPNATYVIQLLAKHNAVTNRNVCVLIFGFHHLKLHKIVGLLNYIFKTSRL